MQEQTDGPKAPRQVGGALAVCVVAGFCALGGFATGWLWRPLPPKPAVVLAHAAHKRLPPPPPPYTFPAGGRVLAGAYRFVALYGSPDEPALGALGQQGIADAVSRAKQVADPYRPLSSQPILPAFEIIATVASGTPTENGDYSREVDPAKIMDWVHAARDAGMYVVIDLQPGRSDFLSQAKQYETVLREPNVGLALDPEWRLTQSQRPLEQIGSVGIDEVNGVASWLSSLVATEHLPQKLFVLHQFRLDMLPSRELLNTAHPELAFVIQMDGQGDQPAKQNTWQAITASPPPNVEFGWKNFYMKDSPMLDPAATMQIAPQPWYVSYQ
ncbi:MAG TPA: hypothetical protein VF466_01370 [Candidatus Saccharimonadales bacterium]